MIATTIAVMAFIGALLAIVECVAMIKRCQDFEQRISYLEYLHKKRAELDEERRR